LVVLPVASLPYKQLLALALPTPPFRTYSSAPPPATPSHEPLVHQSRRENPASRGMVLACRFRRSGLRFPLSGLACAHVATDEVAGFFRPLENSHPPASRPRVFLG